MRECEDYSQANPKRLRPRRAALRHQAQLRILVVPEALLRECARSGGAENARETVMTRTEVSHLFRRNKNANRVAWALATFFKLGVPAERGRVSTGGSGRCESLRTKRKIRKKMCQLEPYFVSFVYFVPLPQEKEAPVSGYLDLAK
jgi:hypothetical protein